jgi:sporulation protein YlmC with PRC-barrel domain
VVVLVSLDKLVRKKVITAKAHFLGEVKGAEVDVDIFTTIIKITLFK